MRPALSVAAHADGLVALFGLLRRGGAALHRRVGLRRRSRRVRLGGQALARARLRAGRARAGARRGGRAHRALRAGGARRRRVLVGLGRARLLVHVLRFLVLHLAFVLALVLDIRSVAGAGAGRFAGRGAADGRSGARVGALRAAVGRYARTRLRTRAAAHIGVSRLVHVGGRAAARAALAVRALRGGELAERDGQKTGKKKWENFTHQNLLEGKWIAASFVAIRVPAPRPHPPWAYCAT